MSKSRFELFGDIAATALPVVTGILILILYPKHPELYKFLFAFALSNAIVHLIKAVTFAPRPNAKEGEWVKWKLSINSGDSFPSGHTASAMAAAFYAHYVLNPYLSLGFFIVALFVALSRVDAKAHFYRDVFFGTIISKIVCALVFFNLFGISTWCTKI